MMPSMPPDGFADESGPPDGFADGQQPQQPDTMLNRVAGGITKAENSVSDFMKPLGQAAQPYMESQFGSPSQMLQSVPPLLNKILGKAGGMATQSLSSGPNRTDPYTAAGVGTVISMGQDIAMAGINPMAEEANVSKAVPEVAKPFGRRALGIPKSMLKTPFARGQADKAAGVALENNVIPWNGNPEVALERAENLSNKSGQEIGRIREAAGSHPMDSILNDLESLRSSEATSKNSIINSRIDRAKNLILGLMNEDNSPIRSIKSKTTPILKTTNSPVSIFGKTSPIEYSIPDVLTGESHITDLGKQKTVVGGRKDFDILGVSNRREAPDLVNKERDIVTGGGQGDIMGSYRKPESFSLNKYEALKKELSDSVNWLNDNATQIGNKKVISRIEKSIENLIGKNQDLKPYKEAKRLFGASKMMEKGLNNEVAGQMGNRMFSPYSVIPAAGEIAAGNPIKAAATLGLVEGGLRRSAGTTARGLTEAYRAAPAVAEVGSKTASLVAPHGKFVRQDGKIYKWNGTEYIEVQ